MTAEFTHVAQACAESRLVAHVRTAIAMVAAAWSSSSIGRRAAAWRAAGAATSPVAQLRWYAMVIAIAIATHLAIRAVMTDAVRPALPAALPGGVAVLAAIVAWQPQAFIRAWRSSRLARALQLTMR